MEILQVLVSSCTNINSKNKTLIMNEKNEQDCRLVNTEPDHLTDTSQIINSILFQGKLSREFII